MGATGDNGPTVISCAAVQHVRDEWTLDGERPGRKSQVTNVTDVHAQTKREA